ncbi:MAG: antitoxin Xre/MbcA/ParS toxin-binding domain-containing protein [Pseudomonadota bacterium]
MTGAAVSRVLNALREEGGLQGTDIAALTDVSKATVHRWITGKAAPQPKNELIISDLNYVVLKLKDYYKPENIRLWLHSRHPQLGGERAIDLIHQHRTDEVLTVIARLDADAFI